MRPLLYSEKEAESSSTGWMRTGHHISYTRSYGYNRNPLLNPEMIYYVLEWQMVCVFSYVWKTSKQTYKQAKTKVLRRKITDLS